MQRAAWSGLSLVLALMAAASVASPDWIERVLGLQPDLGDGSTEWGWALSLAAASAFSAWRAWSRSKVRVD